MTLGRVLANCPPGKDGGVDILALKDPFVTQTPRIKIQVKRENQTVAVDGLRSFMAILSDEDVGIFVSLGGFTKDAQLEARTQEKRRVTLIDLDKFFELWIEYYSKLSEPARQRLPIKPVYFLAPKDWIRIRSRAAGKKVLRDPGPILYFFLARSSFATSL